MFCSKCGKENPEGVNFCGICGTKITTTVYTPSHINTSARVSHEQMTFGKSISTCMTKYIVFNGRASQPEYWWFYLFTVLLNWGSLIVDQSGALFGIVNLGLMLPILSASVRRLHDTNRSGWWVLITLTIIGIIPYIVWLASKGKDQPNDYGSPVYS